MTPPLPAPPWAPALLDKYEEMLRLRRGDLDGSIPDPRLAMVVLARSFPGALREIDELPMAELERRVSWLRALGSGEAEASEEAWAPLMHRYHQLLRGALAAKRWLGRRRVVGAEDRRDFERQAGALLHADDARGWSDRLGALARPATGRVTDEVLARLGEESGQPVEHVRRELFAFGKSHRGGPAARAGTAFLEQGACGAEEGAPGRTSSVGGRVGPGTE